MSLLSALILIISGSVTPYSAQNKSFTVEDELNRRWPADQTPACAFSPDGKWVAIVTTSLGAAQISEQGRIASGIYERFEGSRIDLVSTESDERIEINGRSTSYGPVWSPTGDYLAFLSTRGGQLSVWLWERSSKTVRKLQSTFGRVSRVPWHLPMWSPDGRNLLVQFVERQTPPSMNPTGCGGRRGPIVVEYRPPEIANAGRGEVRKAETVAASDRLALINIVSSAIKDVGRVTSQAGWRQISPDGKWVAHLEYSGPDIDVGNSLYDLHVHDLVRHEDRIIARNVPFFSFTGLGAAWSPDSTAIAYLASGWEHDPTPSVSSNLSNLYDLSKKPRSELWVAYLDGRAPKLLKERLLERPDGRMRFAVPVWMPDSQALLVLANGSLLLERIDRTRQDRLFSLPDRRIIDLLGSRERLGFTSVAQNPETVIVVEQNEENGDVGYARLNLLTGASNVMREEPSSSTRSAMGMDVSPDGRQVVYVRERADLPPEFQLADTRFAVVRKLTELNPELDHIRFGQGRLIDFRSSDGDKIKASLLLPPSYQPGDRIPLIVVVYPDAHANDEVSQFGLAGVGPMNMQLLASRGYGVLKPDVLLHTGWPVESLARCVLPAIQTVVAMGIADPDAIGIMGHSAGGMATVALLTRSTMFKAAIAASGYYDLFSTYGTGGAVMLSGYNAIVTTPWKNQRVFLENSPLLNLDRVRTALLIIVGEKDSMNALQSDELFADLKDLGQRVTLVKYPDEGHVPFEWSSANQIDYFNRMIAWFDKYLKKRTPESPIDQQKPN